MMKRIELRKGGLQVVLAPEAGGKIVSIRDGRDGREWLWSNPNAPHRPTVGGKDFVGEFDTGGWDECFPTVDPSDYPLAPFEGRPCGDHGFLWNRPWRMEDLSAESATLVADAEEWGIRVTRRTALTDEGEFLCDYVLENRGDHEFAGVWATHPLFAVEEGTRLEFPMGTTLKFSQALGSGSSWTSRGAVMDASELPSFRDVEPGGREAFAVKFMTEELTAPWAALEHADGSRLEMHYAADSFDGFAVWANQREWAGIAKAAPYLNVGIEPMCGRRDALEDAVGSGAPHLRVPAGAQHRFAIGVRLIPTGRTT